MNALAGTRIIESPWLTESKEFTEYRPFRERWFSLPWHPFTYTKSVWREVPSMQSYQLGPNTLMMHPAAVAKLHEMFAEKEKAYE